MNETVSCHRDQNGSLNVAMATISSPKSVKMVLHQNNFQTKTTKPRDLKFFVMINYT